MSTPNFPPGTDAQYTAVLQRLADLERRIDQRSSVASAKPPTPPASGFLMLTGTDSALSPSQSLELDWTEHSRVGNPNAHIDPSDSHSIVFESPGVYWVQLEGYGIVLSPSGINGADANMSGEQSFTIRTFPSCGGFLPNGPFSGNTGCELIPICLSLANLVSVNGSSLTAFISNDGVDTFDATSLRIQIIPLS